MPGVWPITIVTCQHRLCSTLLASACCVAWSLLLQLQHVIGLEIRQARWFQHLTQKAAEPLLQQLPTFVHSSSTKSLSRSRRGAVLLHAWLNVPKKE